MQKRGAVELSFSTIVILVLAMTMLILGLVLIRSIFSGAKYNVDSLNDKVRGEINQLFEEDNEAPLLFYLPNNEAKINQGDSYGVAFGVQNIESGGEASQFDYTMRIDDIESLNENCGINENTALGYIKLGKTGSATITPGNANTFLIRFEIPKTAPICMIRYAVELNKDGESYDSGFFDVNIR